MVKPYCSVIIPAHNQAETLPLTLVSLDHELSKKEYSYEIIIVDNASTDTTASSTEELSALINNVRLVKLPEKKEIGEVLKEGNDAARGSWRVLFSADEAVSINAFDDALPVIMEGHDVILGAAASPPLMHKLANAFFRTFLKSPMRDFTLPDFRCFSDEVAGRIFESCETKNEGVFMEQALLVEELRHRVKELPVEWKRESLPFSFYWNVFKTARRLRAERAKNFASQLKNS